MIQRLRRNASDWAFKLMVLHGLQALRVRVTLFPQEPHAGKRHFILGTAILCGDRYAQGQGTWWVRISA